MDEQIPLGVTRCFFEICYINTLIISLSFFRNLLRIAKVSSLLHFILIGMCSIGLLPSYRHPNVIQTARTIFLLLATALIFETLGYYAHSWFYMVAFIAVYMTILVCFLSHLYWDGSNPGVVHTLKRFRQGCAHLFKHPRELKRISWPFVILALGKPFYLSIYLSFYLRPFVLLAI